MLSLRLSVVPPECEVYLTPVHLQKGDLNNKHRGKSVKYCELILAANPCRPFVLCVLTNTVDLEVYKVTRSAAMDGQDLVECSSVVTMAGTAQFPAPVNQYGWPSGFHQCGLR